MNNMQQYREEIERKKERQLERLRPLPPDYKLPEGFRHIGQVDATLTPYIAICDVINAPAIPGDPMEEADWDDGVVMYSGDGIYPVVAHHNQDGNITEARIIFTDVTVDWAAYAKMKNLLHLFTDEPDFYEANTALKEALADAVHMSDWDTAQEYMEAFQDKYSHVGANDSETRNVIYGALNQTFPDDKRDTFGRRISEAEQKAYVPGWDDAPWMYWEAEAD